MCAMYIYIYIYIYPYVNIYIIDVYMYNSYPHNMQSLYAYAYPTIIVRCSREL